MKEYRPAIISVIELNQESIIMASPTDSGNKEGFHEAMINPDDGDVGY